MAACPYVTFFVPIAFETAIDTCKHHIVSDVEFTIFVEKGFIDIGLYDVGEKLSILMFAFW